MSKLLNFRSTGLTYRGKEILSYDDVYLIEVDQDLIYLDGFDQDLPIRDVEVAFLLSRHSSVSGTPCLTTHASGNLTNEAFYGGKPKSLAIAHPHYMSSLLRKLHQQNMEYNLDFLVSLEATHHGPTEVNIPLLFVEIGSKLEDWKNIKAAKAVAHAVVDTIKEHIPTAGGAVGFGGGHYPPKISQYVLKNGVVGHIFPKYVLSSEVDMSIIEKAMLRTFGGCTSFIIDWKGVPGGVRQKLIEVAKLRNLSVVEI